MATKGFSARIRKVIQSGEFEDFTGKDLAKKLKIKYSRIAPALQYLEKTDKIRSVAIQHTGKRGRPRKVYINNMGNGGKNNVETLVVK